MRLDEVITVLDRHTGRRPAQRPAPSSPREMITVLRDTQVDGQHSDQLLLPLVR